MKQTCFFLFAKQDFTACTFLFPLLFQFTVPIKDGNVEWRPTINKSQTVHVF